MPDREPIEQPMDATSVEGKRYTPLKPTIWMTGVLVWATVIGLFLRVPTWAGIFLCLLTGLSFLLYLGSYLYLMTIDRETLRAESYSVKRLPSSQRSTLIQIPNESLEDDLAPFTDLKKPLSGELRVALTKEEAR